MNPWWLLIGAVCLIAFFLAWRLPIHPDAEPYLGPEEDQ